jgi:chitodextrinase
MEINKLRLIIKEAVSAYNLKEIEEAAENAALDAKLEAYDKAIQTCEAKIHSAENIEEIKDLMDDGKINELKKHLKNLQKSKEKLEKVKAKKNKGKEVVTDEPVEEAEIEEADKYNPENSWNDAEVNDPFNMSPMDEADLSDEEKEELRKKAEQNPSLALPEGTLNEAFLKMQKLAGVITEAQYNQKKRLIENENKKFTPAIEGHGGYHLNITDKMKQDIKNQLGIEDEDIKFGYEEEQGDRSYWFATIDVNIEALPEDKKSSYKDIISKIVKPAKTDDKTSPTNSPKTAKSGLLNKIKSAFSENQKKSLTEAELTSKKAADTTEKAAEDLADNPEQVKQALTKVKQAGIDLNLVKQAADQLKQGKSYEDVLKSISSKVQENLNEISAADYRSKEKKQGIGFGGLAGAFISMFPAFGAYTAGAAGTAASTSSPDLLIAMGIVALAGAAIGYAFRDKGSGAGSTSGEVVTDTGILNTAAWEFKNQMTKQGRSNTLPNVDLFYIVDHGETPEELKGKEVWRFKVENRDVVGDKDALFQSSEGKSVSDGSDRDKRRKKGDYS